MLPLCAISVDVARWYLEVARVQNVADAAATAGVTWLPDNFSGATTTAIDVATDNGYPNSGNTTVTTAVGCEADPAGGHDQLPDLEPVRRVVRRSVDDRHAQRHG